MQDEICDDMADTTQKCLEEHTPAFAAFMLSSDTMENLPQSHIALLDILRYVWHVTQMQVLGLKPPKLQSGHAYKAEYLNINNCIHLQCTNPCTPR